MAKTYFLWTQHKCVHGHISHIAPVMAFNWSNFVTCTEVGLGRVNDDPRELGILETDRWAELNATQPEGDTLLDRMKIECGMYNIKLCTAQEALDYCNAWYPSGEDPAYFTLDVDGFTLIDGRPVEVL